MSSHVPADLPVIVTGGASEAGRLWAVVTCAGVDVPGRLEDVDAEIWEHTVVTPSNESSWP